MYSFHSMKAILHLLKSSGAIPNNPDVRKRESLFALTRIHIPKFEILKHFWNDLSNPMSSD